MKIKLNKKYRTRHGKVVRIIETTESPVYPFGTNADYTVTKNGKRFDYDESDWDLVERVRNFKFKAGRQYFTREGNPVTLTDIEHYGRYVFSGDNGYDYTIDGKMYIDTKSECDLLRPPKIKVGGMYVTRSGQMAGITKTTSDVGFYRYEYSTTNGCKFGVSKYGEIFENEQSDYDIVDVFPPDDKKLYIGAKGHVYRVESGLATKLTGLLKGQQFPIAEMNLVGEFNGLCLEVGSMYVNERGDKYEIIHIRDNEHVVAMGANDDSLRIYTRKGCYNECGTYSYEDLIKEV
jgi:hypothetical protein